MSYQHFTIIFVLIVLPLSIVLSFYIKNQEDMINLQSSYQTKLESATYDAIISYQLNSMNTQRVSGQSVKTYVSASINTFFTTLSSNLGMMGAAKNRLQAYVPAILFTTYDGYYIYSPTKTKQVAINEENGQAVLKKDGSIVYTSQNSHSESDYIVEENVVEDIDNNMPSYLTTNADNAKDISSYMLKPFIYYSARYKSNNSSLDFVASYSLDNYLTLYGNDKNGKYFTKSGYLIDTDKINIEGSLCIKLLEIKSVDGTTWTDITGGNSLNSSEIQEYLENIYEANVDDTNIIHNHIKYLPVDIKTQPDIANNFINDYTYEGISTLYNNNYTVNKISKENNAIISERARTGDQVIRDTLEISNFIKNSSNSSDVINNLLSTNSYTPITVKYNDVEITDQDAMEYYIKAYFFSNWVKNNLGEVKASNIDLDYIFKNDDGTDKITGDTKKAFYDFKDDETRIFNIDSNNNPESEDSDYQEHKRNVIKNTIQYNLNSAISTYSENFYNLNDEYRLPIISENDWNKILNNVSMTTFMQGVPLGPNRFNGYAVVKSSDNNTSVDIDSMYFVAENAVDDGQTFYHKYDCPDLGLAPSTASQSSEYYWADQSAEFKYDAMRVQIKTLSDDESMIVALYDEQNSTYYKPEIDAEGNVTFGDKIDNNNYKQYVFEYTDSSGNQKTMTIPDITLLPNAKVDLKNDKYLYDHKNLACYTCCVSNIYSPVVKYYKGDLRRTCLSEDKELLVEMGKDYFVYASTGKKYVAPNGEKEIKSSDLDNDIDKYGDFEKRKIAVYTYIAHIRNNLYKHNDYINR